MSDGRSRKSLERVEHELLNPPGFDPGLVLGLVGLRRTVLFDLGENRLPTGRLLEVSDLFVSHAHIDHFAGFDRLLRSLLGRTRHVRIHGLPGLQRNVQGKLHGYLWNLDFAELVTFDVHELQPSGSVVRTRYSLGDRFEQGRPLSPWEAAADERGARVLLDEGPFRVVGAVVDHGWPCLALALVQAPRYGFSAQALEAAGVQPGPQLGELKQRILAGEAPAEAERLGSWMPEQRIAYVTDCGLTRTTVQGALAVAAGADVLYCEATFPDSEQVKAAGVRHLTGGQAGALARVAGARRLVPFHFSRKHAGEPRQILEDVERALHEDGPWTEKIRDLR